MNENQYDWAFGLQWFVICAAGVAIFGIAAFFSIWTVGGAAEEVLGETAGAFVAGALFGALFALGASVGTGFLLRSRGIDARRWVGYSVSAGAIGGALFFTVMISLLGTESRPEGVVGLIMGLAVGLPVGIGQWLTIRDTGVSANLWPVIMGVTFTLAMGIGLPLGGEGREMISIASMSLLVGAVTALGMVWLQGRQTAAVA